MIVKDIAVLIDLDKRNAFVFGRGVDHAAKMLDVNVDRTSHKRRLARYRQRQRVNRIVDSSHRRRLRFLAQLRRRTVLPLGQAIDAVVEEYVVEIEVASNCVNEMVAADRKRVTVPGYDPDTQLRIRTLDSSGHRRRATMNRVEAVGVHVVRKT